MRTWSYHVTASNEEPAPFDIVIEAPTEAKAAYILFHSVYGMGATGTSGPALHPATAHRVLWEVGRKMISLLGK